MWKIKNSIVVGCSPWKVFFYKKGKMTEISFVIPICGSDRYFYVVFSRWCLATSNNFSLNFYEGGKKSFLSSVGAICPLFPLPQSLYLSYLNIKTPPSWSLGFTAIP